MSKNGYPLNRIAWSAIPPVPNWSETAFVTITTIYIAEDSVSPGERGREGSGQTMVGRMYVSAPVSSNMMTTTVTVMRVIPL